MKLDDGLSARVNQLLSSIMSCPRIYSDFKRISSYDASLAKHSYDVAFHSSYLGFHTGLSEKEIKELSIGALLHDLGKIFLPNHILNSPLELDSHDKEVIESHVVYGGRFLSKRGYSLDVISAVMISHERQLNPYPRKTNNASVLREDDRRKQFHPDYLDIIPAVDIFQALKESRPYHPLLSKDKIENTVSDTYRGQKIFPEQLFKMSK